MKIQITSLFGGEIDILNVDLDKINPEYVNLMKMILKLLFMSDLWLGVIGLSNANYMKKI